VLGSTEPRIWTPPLRPLNEETSVGFEQVRFARNVLRRPPDPWQEWLWIHGGELREDGLPRYHTILTLAARQNGKTETPSILSAYWLAVDRPGLIVGTSTKLEYAAETWDKTRKIIENCRALHTSHLEGRKWWVRGAGLTEMRFLSQEDDDPTIERRYRIAAANEEGARSLTVRRAIADELRQHESYAAWSALEPATEAVADSQIWALSNAGSDKSVVLNDLQGAAHEFIATGRGDPGVGIFEWSAPDDADPEDPAALAMANPNYGRRINAERMQNKARSAVAKGGEALTLFKTESMCIRVKVMNPAVDPGMWLRCRVPGTLDEAKTRVAACLDVAPDGGHVTLSVAAVLQDGRVRAEVVGSWDSTVAARIQLPGLLGRVRPVLFGWFPQGPAAAMAGDLHLPDGFTPDRWKRVAQPIQAEMAAACMGLDDLVRGKAFLHSGDMLLDQHVGECERVKRGARWVFGSASGGHIDAAYSVAGAVHLARMLPPPAGRPRLVVAGAE